MARLALLVGGNPYGTTLHFAKGLETAAKNLGHQATLHWVDEGQFFQAVNAWKEAPPDYTLSFSDMQLGEGVSLADQLPFPHITMLLDPAIYFLHHLNAPRGHVTCVDRHDVTLFSKMGIKPPLFLPHAADGTYQPDLNQKRLYDYVFFGSCIDFRELAKTWPARFGGERAVLLNEVSMRVLFTQSSILSALVEAGARQEELPSLHREVDLYIRGRERVELLKAFPEALIWGEGPWERFFPKERCRGALPFEDSLKIMQQAKIVLNAKGRFKESSHERLLYALLSGALPLTHSNPYLAQAFSTPDHMLLYPKGAWKEARQLGEAYLGKAQELAYLGALAVKEAHLWEHRLRRLLSSIP